MATRGTNAGTGIDVTNEELVADAYARVEAELAKLDPSKFIQLNLDIPTAVSTVLGVLPKLESLRDPIATELPGFDLASFDQLEDYALALSFTHTNYLTAARPADDLLALVEEALRLRETLLADAKALSLRSLIDRNQLARLKGVNGYKNIAQDLQILSQVLQHAWPQIQTKSATTLDDLQTASRMATRLQRIVGLRERPPAQLAILSDQRLRAFTQLIRTYEAARRAVGYLHALTGDADSIAPSLYPGRPRRRKAELASAQQATTAARAEAQVERGAAQPAVSAAAAATQVAEKAGHAGGQPFMH
ncbi:MAG TPA: hypothetical protein VHW01_06480 [Polyangiaceae bacterium]|jgi:hypothetical protein|nr:hypothetical protein [Polyangiaceae bacterium]